MQKGEYLSAEFKQELIIYSGFSLASIVVGMVLLLQDSFDFAISKPLGFFFLCFPVALLLNFVKVQYHQERRRGRFLTSILRTTPNVIFVFDWNNRKTQLINDGFPSLGYSDQEVDNLGPTLLSALVPPEEQAHVMDSFQKTLMAEGSMPQSYDWRMRAKDGSTHTFKVSQSDLSNDKNNPMIICFAEDITNQKTLEKTVEQEQQYIEKVEKFAVLRSLGSGVTHEINNYLSIICGSAEASQSKISRGQATSEQMNTAFGKIEINARKIAKTIGVLRLLTSYNQSANKELLQLKTVFEDVESLWSQRLKNHDFEFTLQYPDEAVFALVKRSEIVIALINLISNSFEHLKTADLKWIKIGVSIVGSDAIEISVTDSGRGISGQKKDKLFEPFFTTKKQGEAAGLGLSLVKKIITEHGGTVAFDENSVNTKFVINLPCLIDEGVSVKAA